MLRSITGYDRNHHSNRSPRCGRSVDAALPAADGAGQQPWL